MTAMILYAPCADNLVKNLEEDLEELKAAIAECNYFVEASKNELHQYNLDLSTEILQLEAILADKKAAAENTVNDFIEGLGGSSGPTFDAEDIHLEEVVIPICTDSEELAKKCKRLYRKICIQCHPDKTKSNNMISVMQEARKAYDRGDYNMLMQLLTDGLIVGQLDLSESLTGAEYVNYLNLEIAKSNTTLGELQETEEFELAELQHSDGIEFAVLIRAKAFRITINELKDEINELENL